MSQSAFSVLTRTGDIPLEDRPELHQMAHRARIVELRDYDWSKLDYELAKHLHSLLPPDIDI